MFVFLVNISRMSMYIQEDENKSMPLNFTMVFDKYISILYGTDGKQRVSVSRETKGADRNQSNSIKGYSVSMILALDMVFLCVYMF